MRDYQLRYSTGVDDFSHLFEPEGWCKIICQLCDTLLLDPEEIREHHRLHTVDKVKSEIEELLEADVGIDVVPEPDLPGRITAQACSLQIKVL